jgi:hypothetical protein
MLDTYVSCVHYFRALFTDINDFDSGKY